MNDLAIRIVKSVAQICASAPRLHRAGLGYRSGRARSTRTRRQHPAAVHSPVDAWINYLWDQPNPLLDSGA